MPPASGPAPALTTKQAKAAYKARGRPTLSDKQSRQLERSLELEQRAECLKEIERRRAEAAKKRAERDTRDRAAQVKAQLGSQRRTDRFGYKSSQFHLGAFFGRKPDGRQDQHVQSIVEEDEDEDLFRDDGLDDESLLEALQSPAVPKQPQQEAAQRPRSEASLMPPPRLPIKPTLQHRKTEPAPRIDEDLSSFFDELDSSTQIARDLNGDEARYDGIPEIRRGSFSSGSLDLTEEDLDALDPPKPAKAATVVHSLPAKTKPPQQMPPPPPPTKRPATTTSPFDPQPPPKRLQPPQKQSSAIRGPFLPASSLYCSPNLGFTLTQLEAFVDDDIQLTQAPG